MRLAVGATLLCLVAAGCSGTESDARRYQRWLEAGHREQVFAYETYLRTASLDQVVPMRELLRSGRRWRRCKADEFTVPPRAEWQSMATTLALVAEMKAAGLLPHARVASGWRTPAFNRCEGGSTRSRHLRNNALDFDLTGEGARVDALCAYWRRHGAKRNFGLGFYSPTKIHVDTSGFRTWGRSHHRESSLCAREAVASR